MPLTFTGRHVTPDNAAHPSLVDIAVGLSRQPRFAGQTRRWWSVLDHTLFGDELIQQAGDALPGVRLAWLLHDAHEALTGDVPKPIKPPELKALQAVLDRRIYGAYYYGYDGYWDHFIREIDGRCLRAEAMLVGPPTANAQPSLFGIDPSNATQTGEDKAVLHRAIQREGLGAPPTELAQEDHPLVKTFLSRIMALI